MEKEKHNPKQKAVALSYTKGETAPLVVAKGQGYVAEKIMKTAKDEDISIIKDTKLVEELIKIDLGDNIPPELYQVVAEILIFISNMDKQEEYRKYGK